MNAIPESLRRVIAAQQGKQPAQPANEPVRDCTIIWRDGQVLRVSPEGKVRQLQSIAPILN